jgi:hypothetical protein
MPDSEEGRSDLAVLFPIQEVEIGEGISVKMRPVPLDKMSEVMDSFVRIIRLYISIRDELTLTGKTATEMTKSLVSGDAAKLVDLAGKDPTEVAIHAELSVKAMKEALRILPHCIIDRPLSEIPHSAFPDLLSVMVEQNVTEDLVKKWIALAGKVSGMTKDVKKQQGLKDQGSES